MIFDFDTYVKLHLTAGLPIFDIWYLCPLLVQHCKSACIWYLIPMSTVMSDSAGPHIFDTHVHWHCYMWLCRPAHILIIIKIYNFYKAPFFYPQLDSLLCTFKLTKNMFTYISMNRSWAKAFTIYMITLQTTIYTHTYTPTLHTRKHTHAHQLVSQ